MIAVEERATFGLFESITYAFSNCHKQPSVTPGCFSHFSAKEREEETTSQVLVDVMPLIDLIRLEEQLLIEKVEPAREIVRLLWELGGEEVG